MKLKEAAIITGFLLFASALSAQTLTEVIKEFNAGAESLKDQEYETALEHFNKSLEMSEVVGEEADDMKAKAQEQIPATYYRQAVNYMKRRQYEEAVPYLEKTVEFAEKYDNNEEIAAKANKYLPPLYLRKGNMLIRQEKYEEAVETFDKALAMDNDLYKVHQGKGLAYLKQEKIDKMIEEFDIAREKAKAADDQDVIDDINKAIDGYYRPIIEEERMMIDPMEGDYTFLIDICDEAIEANETNGFAYFQAASAYNKMVEYDSAIEYAERGLEYEQNPTITSALYLELGKAYQNTAQYDKACEAFKNVTDDQFLSSAKKNMENVPGCE